MSDAVDILSQISGNLLNLYIFGKTKVECTKLDHSGYLNFIANNSGQRLYMALNSVVHFCRSGDIQTNSV